MVKFECSGCSLCCTKVGRAVKDARSWIMHNKKSKPDARTLAVAKFPYKFVDGNKCEKLIDGKCSVYDERPDVCNVEKSFELFAGTRTKEQYFKENAVLCNKWIRKAGLDEKFIVNEKY